MNTKPLYVVIARTLNAYHNCVKNNNVEWETKHRQRLDRLVDGMPSGSGIDCGTKLVLSRSTEDRLIFKVEYHHMNEVGYYDGWTEHNVIVTPSLSFEFNIHITGKNKNDIKDYLGDLYHDVLSEQVPEYEPIEVATQES